MIAIPTFNPYITGSRDGSEVPVLDQDYDTYGPDIADIIRSQPVTRIF